MKSQIRDRIIPLPKSIKAKGGYEYYKNRIMIMLKTDLNPLIESGLSLLERYTEKRYIKAEFTIELAILNRNYVEKGLNKCENLDQAYIIKPIIKNKKYSGVKLLAYTDLGLYYACTSLYQLILPVSPKKVEIPLVTIYDWPSIDYRGLNLGNYEKKLREASFYKLNAIDLDASIPNTSIYDKCNQTGIRPFKTYYEWEDPLSLMEKAAKDDKSKDLVFWMHEDWTESQLMERTNQLIKSYNEFSKDNKRIKIGIVTNEKSKTTFEKLFGLNIPSGFSISYCDREKTYSTDVKELTDSNFKKAAKREITRGIYPMIAFDQEAFFFWTAPEFIKFRCAEFERIGLQKVMGYLPYAYELSDFNITAFAEWLWNPKGRNTVEFIKAYSHKHKLDFDFLENCLYYLTYPSWSLQRSNFVQIVCQEMINFKKLEKISKLGQMIKDAANAAKYARHLNHEDFLVEAQTLYFSYMAYKETMILLNLTTAKNLQKKKYIESLDKLTLYCTNFHDHLMEWLDKKKDQLGAYDLVVIETAKSFLRLPEYFKLGSNTNTKTVKRVENKIESIIEVEEEKTEYKIEDSIVIDEETELEDEQEELNEVEETEEVKEQLEIKDEKGKKKDKKVKKGKKKK